jgi:hypothetical protein
MVFWSILGLNAAGDIVQMAELKSPDLSFAAVQKQRF